LELPTARALSLPLWIHPAQPNVRAGAGTCTVDPSPYNASSFARPALQSRLQNGTRDVDLFVLESSWPDPASEASSRRELAARFANVRSELTFPTQTLQTAPQTSPGDPRSAHAREVMSSLAAFAPLSPRV